jgi:hypothetical protein
MESLTFPDLTGYQYAYLQSNIKSSQVVHENTEDKER